jgi:hypothetical protein
VTEQLCFSFDGSGPQSISGVELWRERRRVQIVALSEVTGLPIGHAVRLTLASGPVVEGILFLVDEGLWLDSKRSCDLRLRIAAVDFLAADWNRAFVSTELRIGEARTGWRVSSKVTHWTQF